MRNVQIFWNVRKKLKLNSWRSEVRLVARNVYYAFFIAVYPHLSYIKTYICSYSLDYTHFISSVWATSSAVWSSKTPRVFSLSILGLPLSEMAVQVAGLISAAPYRDFLLQVFGQWSSTPFPVLSIGLHILLNGCEPWYFFLKNHGLRMVENKVIWGLLRPKIKTAKFSLFNPWWHVEGAEA
jgi:hypothetical protein